jgi:3-oxoacyl-[acyl-carrier protein] reductase
MTDRYQQFTQTPPGRLLAGRLGLPRPVTLRRFRPGDPVLNGPVAIGAAPGGRLLEPAAKVLAGLDADARVLAHGPAQAAADAGGLTTTLWDPATDEAGKLGAIVFDASGIDSVAGLQELYTFLHPVIRRLRSNGRLIVLGTTPTETGGVGERAAQRSLEGFVRSAAKELSSGSTGQLVYVAPGGEGELESTLRFLLSGRSAYVDGQVVRIGPAATASGRRGKKAAREIDWDKPLDGQVALVTGASRGIGEAIAQVLARDGAHVVCLDVPAQGEALAAVANSIGGSTLAADVTDTAAPAAIAEHVKERHGGVDIVVHNAGVTRDKTLGRMSPDKWDLVMAINLEAPERITEALVEADVLKSGGRVIGVSSMSGIAGNRGQTNYATSKAGLIGLVDALAPKLAERQTTINAVAPGFIETQMTSAMPTATREAGRRMNSLAQGGLPVDVAETIAWFASPASAGVTGNTIRVCGQSLLGA